MVKFPMFRGVYMVEFPLLRLLLYSCPPFSLPFSSHGFLSSHKMVVVCEMVHVVTHFFWHIVLLYVDTTICFDRQLLQSFILNIW